MTPKPLTALLATLFLILLVSCSTTSTVVEQESSEAPQRIVSLVPAVTEMLFALGAGDRVVGVSDYDTYPPEALERPRVGALINPNIEKIFELQPDLVITYGTQALLRDRLAVAGIRQYPFLHGPIEEMLTYVQELGRELRLEDRGLELAQEIRSELSDIRDEGPPDNPTVFLVHSRVAGTMGTFYSGGKHSFFNELIEIAGGDNIFGDVDDDSLQPSLEEVLKRQPEVIIELVPSDRGDRTRIAERLNDWQKLDTVPAVKNGRVYILAGDYLLLIGPRLHLAARRLAEAIRGDAVTPD